MSRALAGILVLVWLAMAPVAAQQQGVITDIRFVGNETTKARIMLQQMVVKAGDPIDSERIELSRQAIMDLGLFKSVTAALIPDDQGAVLEITVSEKYYIIPLPKLDRSADGIVSYGGELSLDNLGGLNQKLRLVYQAQSGCCQASGTVNTYSVNYAYPRVLGTEYGLGASLSHEVTPTVDSDPLGNPVSEYNKGQDRLDFGLSHWLIREGPAYGWSVGVSGFWRHLTYAQQGGTTILYGPQKAVGLAFSLGYTKVHDLLYSRDGVEFGISSEHGFKGLGSDTPYGRNQFYYRQYRPVGRTPHTNLNLQVRLGTTAGDVPVDDYPYGIGGSRDLRGYATTIEGRSYFIANIEYLHPLFGHPAARGLLFVDVGNAYPDNRILDLGNVDTSAGVGLRYQFKSFVNLQLRLDMAYAFGLSQRKVYVGVNNTF